MGKHRSARRPEPGATNRHRAEVRPRYGRIATLGSAVTVTLIAVMGGTGALPSAAGPPRAAAEITLVDRIGAQERDVAPDPTPAPSASPAPSPQVDATTGSDAETEKADDGLVPIAPGAASALDTALPPDSGTGRRVVFSESRQRTWLIGDDGTVQRTYLVSGSIYENLEPGTFEVYSRSEDAVGIDDSGTMKYFVRFTQGTSGAAIGFHDIPVLDGERIQTFAELGTPLSHGCVRQKRSDAIALWEFAPLGTTVVVTA